MDDLSSWKVVREYDEQSFESAINFMKIHKGAGLSFPVRHPDYFFKRLYYGRGINAFARIWVCYYRHHGRQCREWLIKDGKGPAHIIATVKEGDGWRILTYYRSEKTYKNEKLGIAEVIKMTLYYDHPRMAIYKNYKEQKNENSKDNDGRK